MQWEDESTRLKPRKYFFTLSISTSLKSRTILYMHYSHAIRIIIMLNIYIINIMTCFPKNLEDIINNFFFLETSKRGLSNAN